MRGILASELRLHIIRPILKQLDLWTLAAENLLLGTAAQESQLGYYLTQQGGPALGIYQIEPATHRDVWDHYLTYRPVLVEKIQKLLPFSQQASIPDSELITNLAYTTAIARLIYHRVPASLPEANDLNGLAAYWKKFYNTNLGKGTIQDFVQHYQEYIQ